MNRNPYDSHTFAYMLSQATVASAAILLQSLFNHVSQSSYQRYNVNSQYLCLYAPAGPGQARPVFRHDQKDLSCSCGHNMLRYDYTIRGYTSRLRQRITDMLFFDSSQCCSAFERTRSLLVSQSYHTCGYSLRQ